MTIDGRPNLVVVVADSWRGDVLGHAGNPAAVSPHLDALVAADAVSFRHAYCQAPVCTPSRTSFLTGWYPHVRGHRTQGHLLGPDEPHLFKRLQQAGHVVWWSGGDMLARRHRWDVRHGPESHPPNHSIGFDPHRDQRWRGAPGTVGYYSFMAGRLPANLADGRRYDPDWHTIEAAIDWLRSTRPRDAPFCVVVNLAFPHPPYAVEEKWSALIDRSRLPACIPEPSAEQLSGKPAMIAGLLQRQGLRSWPAQRWDELRATYYGMCARVDHQIGLLVDCLRTEGLYDETALLFFTDHGDYAGDYGLVEKNQNTFEDPLVRIPLIVKPPAAVPVPDGVSDALVELTDVVATVEELCGLPRAYSQFGRSLLPLVTGRTTQGRGAVFAEGGRIDGERHCMELEATADQVPQGLYYPRLSLQREDGPAHGKAVMCRTRDHKYVYRLYESDELYDLRADPGELDNRIDDPTLTEVRGRLRNRLLRFLVETGDVVPHAIDTH